MQPEVKIKGRYYDSSELVAMRGPVQVEAAPDCYDLTWYVLKQHNPQHLAFVLDQIERHGPAWTCYIRERNPEKVPPHDDFRTDYQGAYRNKKHFAAVIGRSTSPPLVAKLFETEYTATPAYFQGIYVWRKHDPE